MDCEYRHQSFDKFPRRAQSLCNDRCQNILYKAVFEHFIEIKNIAALLLTSKSFQNSSFGANFLVNFVVNEDSIVLLESVLSPSSCFSLQFVPSLHITHTPSDTQKINPRISTFVGELVNTKYLRSSLRSLSLNWVSNEVVPCFFGTSNAWPQLRDLRLEFCVMNDALLEIICNSAVHLRSIHFPAKSTVTDAGLERFLYNLSGITSLNLSGCPNITDAGLQHLPRLSLLTALDVSAGIGFMYREGITDAGLEFISSLSNITCLNLKGCPMITDTGVEHLAKLSNITSLDLTWCASVADAGLNHLSRCSRITFLDLRGCQRITDAGLEHLSALSRITTLDLDNCNKITDEGLEHVSKLTNITRLVLSNCGKITDAGLEHLSKLNSITSLTLCSCERITDDGLDQVAMLPHIKHLDLSWCDQISHDCRVRIWKCMEMRKSEMLKCTMD